MSSIFQSGSSQDFFIMSFHLSTVASGWLTRDLNLHADFWKAASWQCDLLKVLNGRMKLQHKHRCSVQVSFSSSNNPLGFLNYGHTHASQLRLWATSDLQQSPVFFLLSLYTHHSPNPLIATNCVDLFSPWWEGLGDEAGGPSVSNLSPKIALPTRFLNPHGPG